MGSPRPGRFRSNIRSQSNCKGSSAWNWPPPWPPRTGGSWSPHAPGLSPPWRPADEPRAGSRNWVPGPKVHAVPPRLGEGGLISAGVPQARTGVTGAISAAPPAAHPSRSLCPSVPCRLRGGRGSRGAAGRGRTGGRAGPWGATADGARPGEGLAAHTQRAQGGAAAPADGALPGGHGAGRPPAPLLLRRAAPGGDPHARAAGHGARRRHRGLGLAPPPVPPPQLGMEPDDSSRPGPSPPPGTSPPAGHGASWRPGPSPPPGTSPPAGHGARRRHRGLGLAPPPVPPPQLGMEPDDVIEAWAEPPPPPPRTLQQLGMALPSPPHLGTARSLPITAAAPVCK
ncbi:basic proline-rich protein-like [Mauremys mutica]|uniref:basic proline-rich protein-like n=1 Tax=Mauremys mutica TaxID=74926 RepID=UPI001D16FA9C|nr:basic proline-rich protein-like [Mauremys mutica]